MTNDVVIFGTGSFAQLLEFALRVDSGYNVVAFTTTSDKITARTFSGLPVVPFESLTESHPPAATKMFIAVGYTKMSYVRSHFYDEAKSLGYELITFVGSKVLARGIDRIGDNCCIFDSTTLEPFTSIGDDVIVWGGVHIGHHSSIGKHSFLAPRVAIAGHTTIGDHCFLGINATVRDGINIADGSLVGAGATILGDTEYRGVYIMSGTTPYSGDTEKFLA